ncbi:unnamed protein product [Pseudo-nitzschia multistriata]|uniref:Carbohydrate kinase PfkB domain-containing protein n=1 Tax=Pseudo-nitzschia multistriata TaxID=183589 RepID=A0A448Z472_9STRA|nr:unnamed protein product [Pseudo-nitzschia multistriata]
MNLLAFQIITFLFFGLFIFKGLYGNLAHAFSLSTAARRGRNNPDHGNNANQKYKPVVVVGKIIIDEYGDPYPSSGEKNTINKHGDQSSYEPRETEASPLSISIGGGGPQAAFGAAAALAVWDSYHVNGIGDKNSSVSSMKLTPSCQQPIPPVLFLAPVGKDWTKSETIALLSALNTTTSRSSSGGDCKECITPASITSQGQNNNIVTHLIQSEDSITPRIRLWHDQDQVVHWYAINDSFGPKGADGLWRNRPSAEDLVSVLSTENCSECDGIILHVIAEAGKDAAGGQLDCLPLITDPTLVESHLSFLGIEPVASGESIEEEDALSAGTILEGSWKKTSSLDSVFWCPDYALDQAMRKHNIYDTFHKNGGKDKESTSILVSTRDGPRGSQIWYPFGDGSSRDITIPAAALSTKNGEPIDPTGAGNAYSAAMTALLGNSVPLNIAASIATGVGAVVCEYEGLPTAMINKATWSKIVERIHEAATEVRAKLKEEH